MTQVHFTLNNKEVQSIIEHSVKDDVSKNILTTILAIMPSKYTDEIENSSYTWRVFYMSRKSKYSAEQKLAILND